MYEKLDGVYREMSRKAVVGFKYVIKLKHTPSSKFSARSVSFVNAKGIPTSLEVINSTKVYSLLHQ